MTDSGHPASGPDPERDDRTVGDAMQSSFRYFLALLWLVAVAVFIVLLFMPVVTGFENVRLPLGLELDEAFHFLIFAALSMALPLVIRSRLVLVLVVLCLLFLGVFSEFLQLGVPNRRFSEVDMAANLLGCFLGLVLGLVIRKLIFRSRFRKATRDS